MSDLARDCARIRAAGRTVAFYAHNDNHLGLFGGAAARIAAEGVDSRIVSVADPQRRGDISAAVAALGLPCGVFGEEPADAEPGAGDIMVVGNDWGPRPFPQYVDERRAAGARVLGVVEGCRFAKPGRYGRVDEVLVWGPSGRAAFSRPTRDIGCPLIERMIPAPPRAAPIAVINYKFTYGDRDADADFRWLDGAREAARALGLAPVISAHPATMRLPDNAELSGERVEDLLRGAGLLITRASTVLYQALAIDVPVILFALPEDELFEMAEPLGDYQIATDRDGLSACAARLSAGPAPRATAQGAFLARHVSRDPHMSSVDRMARAIASSLSSLI